VMNKQREVIYTRRRRALEGENLHEDIIEMIEIFVEDLVAQFTAGSEYGDGWGWDEIREELLKTMLLPLPVAQDQRAFIRADELEERISEAAVQAYEQKRKILGNDLMSQLERFATLKTIDERWKEHLYEMDQLKEGIGLRAYGQKDPLIEYKQEGFQAFSEMLGRIDQEILEVVFKAQIQVEQAPGGLQQPRREPQREMAALHADSTGMGFEKTEQQPSAPQEAPRVGKRQPVRVENKVGRNDPCPCGSGKKYKHCHGRMPS